MSTETELQSLKVIILGDTGVGKTSLANRQCRGLFTFQITPTIGTAHLKTVVNVGDREVELKIWDTAGQEQFASLVSMYARNSKVCIMVASFVDPGSIANLEVWRDRLKATGENPPIVVAINKMDMQEGAPMTIDQIRETYGEKFPNMFFVSARTGDSVNELFVSAAQEAIKAENDAAAAPGVNINNQNQKSSKCCG